MEPFRVAPSMCSTKVGSMNGLANRDVFGEKDEPVIVVGLAKSEFYFMLVRCCAKIGQALLPLPGDAKSQPALATATQFAATNICTSRGRYRRSHHGIRSCNVHSSFTLYKLPRLWCPTRWGVV
uniref:Uncharacterized protein n=1 Tax=Zea mays TaxID=4577 RepID=A0A804UB61_MAIZE